MSEVEPSGNPQANESESAPSSAIALSRRWLRAFRDGDMTALRRLTCSPFSFRSTLGSISCPSSAQGSHEIEELAGCVRSNGLLVDELKYADDLPNSAEQRPLLPEWTQSLSAEKNESAESVYAYLHGDGVTFGFVLFARKECVEALLLNADFDDDTGS